MAKTKEETTTFSSRLPPFSRRETKEEGRRETKTKGKAKRRETYVSSFGRKEEKGNETMVV
jgi:hypothetical protein